MQHRVGKERDRTSRGLSKLFAKRLITFGLGPESLIDTLQQAFEFDLFLRVRNAGQFLYFLFGSGKPNRRASHSIRAGTGCIEDASMETFRLPGQPPPIDASGESLALLVIGSEWRWAKTDDGRLSHGIVARPQRVCPFYLGRQ